MNSYLTESFLKHWGRLPDSVKKTARKNYRLWKQDPNHPSLEFKRVHNMRPLYSVRIGANWRVLGMRRDDDIYWIWIGSHAEYDRILHRF